MYKIKKILLLSITLTTLTNVSYASFPVNTTTNSIEESINLNESSRRYVTWVYGLASFLLSILGWFFIIIAIGGAMGIARFSS